MLVTKLRREKCAITLGGLTITKCCHNEMPHDENLNAEGEGHKVNVTVLSCP